jgi:hypothetical protein
MDANTPGSSSTVRIVGFGTVPPGRDGVAVGLKEITLEGAQESAPDGASLKGSVEL